MAGQSKRGFAAMLPQKQREIARRGGQTAHKKGTAHEFTPEEARIAGRRGGKAVSSNRQYMAEIGRRGGQSSGRHAGRSHQGQNVAEYGGGGNNGMRGGMKQSVAPKATDLLRADHRKVEELFSQYETQEGQMQSRDAVISQICQELEVHARLEEEIFYPAVRAAETGEGEELVAEAIQEHQTIKDLVAQLEGMSADNGVGDSTVRQLKECVSHHVQEEESEMLPQAEQLLGDQLEVLGAQLQQRKQQLMESPPGSDEAQTPEQQMPQTS
jgi:general stress protein YciG/hemerythrin-like domain-containing protein